MTRIIPYELIKHLEWEPGKEVPTQQVRNAPRTQAPDFDLDSILNGRIFFSDEQEDRKRIGLAVALDEALNYVGDDGIVATMPELIAAKVKADKSHEFWKKWYTVHTEENIGIDKEGRFYGRDAPVLVVVNGGGILTPDRIKQAYREGLVNHSAKYTENEFSELLEGKLPDGSSLDLYEFEDVKDGLTLPHRFGVVMPYQTAKETNSGFHKKEDFLENPLVIARNGGRENLEEYYEKAKNREGDLGNWHVYGGDRDPNVPQGRLLFLDIVHDGLDGFSYLGGNGRFVGVAPEARASR